MNNLIKKWRKEANMTQEELAHLLFLTPQAVSLLENGKRSLQQETLQEIAKIFQKEVIFYVQDSPMFKKVTNQIIEQEIEEKIKKPCIIPIPKEDLEKVLSYEEEAYFSKSNGILLDEAMHGVFRCFEQRNKPLQQAKGIIVLLEGAGNLTYEDIDAIFKTTCNHTDGEAEVIIGCTVNQEEKRGFEVCVLATGY